MKKHLGENQKIITRLKKLAALIILDLTNNKLLHRDNISASLIDSSPKRNLWFGLL